MVAPSSPSIPGRAPAEKPKVLIMDSTLQDNAGMRNFLDLSGCEPVEESDAQRAVALLRAKMVHTLILRTSHPKFDEIITAAREAGARILWTRYAKAGDPERQVDGAEQLNRTEEWDKRLVALFPGSRR